MRKVAVRVVHSVSIAQCLPEGRKAVADASLAVGYEAAEGSTKAAQTGSRTIGTRVLCSAAVIGAGIAIAVRIRAKV